MTERECERVRGAAAGGLPPDAAACAHLERCAACRVELRRFERLRSSLRATAALEPPPALDRAVLEALDRAARSPFPRAVPAVRPFTALGLAAAAFAALVLQLGGELARAGAAEYGLPLAALAAAVYLACSAAATVPLLFLAFRRRVEEVRS